MANMTPEIFVESIIRTFGKYKNQMDNLIKKEMSNYTPETLELLLRKVLTTYKYQTPPNMGKILEIAEKENVRLIKNRSDEEKEILWQCGQCWKVYNYERRICSACGKKTNDLPTKCYCGEKYDDTEYRRSKCIKCTRPRCAGKIFRGSAR